MIQNYFKIAYRNLLRNRSFSFINILGLASGMAVCMFIITLIIDQNDFDTFHVNGDRIFRVTSDDANSDIYATAPLLLKEELPNSFSGIEAIAPIRREGSLDLKFGEKAMPFGGFYTDVAFFDLFSFDLIGGNPKTALVEPFSIVLSEKAATDLGVSVDNLNSTISINDWGDFKLTGILAKPGGKTHLKFDFLISEASVKPLLLAEKGNFSPNSWDDTWYTYVYLMVKENASSNNISTELSAFSKRIYADAERKIEFLLQPLSEISPSKIVNNEISMTMPVLMLSFLSALALLVLLTACFNYTNLSVAKSLTRAKEIGIRKVIGARRWSVMMQFIAEAVLTSILALIFAVIFLELVILPQFQNLFFVEYFEFDPTIHPFTYLSFLGFAILTGIIAGIIPSIYLSAFKPVEVLKSMSSLKVFKKIGIRKVLIVSQLMIAMVFFATVVVLYQQTKLLLHADYGFDKENILNLSLKGNDYEKVKTIMAEHKDIVNISGTSIIPGTGSLQTVDISLPDSTEKINTCQLHIDEKFIKNLDLKLLAGKEFAKESIKGESQVVINKKSVERMGFESPEAAIGTTIIIGNQMNEDNQKPAQIIGVVDDFVHHFIGTKKMPLMLAYNPAKVEVLNLKIVPQNIPSTLAFVEEKWASIDPVHPVKYEFFDAQLYEQIALFEDILKLIGFLAFITILITCMGLLGIANYSVQTRQKEIGIRKVLGADLQRILWTLSKGMLFPILIAIILSTPIIWFFNSLWLEQFAYRITLSLGNIGLGIILLTLLAVGIVVSQSYRVANRNPVKALRTE